MKDNLKCYLISILILVLIPNECTSLSSCESEPALILLNYRNQNPPLE